MYNENINSHVFIALGICVVTFMVFGICVVTFMVLGICVVTFMMFGICVITFIVFGICVVTSMHFIYFKFIASIFLQLLFKAQLLELCRRSTVQITAALPNSLEMLGVSASH